MNKKLFILLTSALMLVSVQLFADSDAARFLTEGWTHPSENENRSFYNVWTPGQGENVANLDVNTEITVYLPKTGWKEITLNPNDDGGVCNRRWFIYDQNKSTIMGDNDAGNWSNAYLSIFDGNYLNTDRQLRINANAPYTAIYVRFKSNGGFCCLSNWNSVLKINIKPASARLGGKSVVMVHGFAGWGRNEALGFKYWGFETDVQAKLRNRGYDVRTATVGPLSSAHDRACELYAQLTNIRTVYYGNAHAAQYGHAASVPDTYFNQDENGWANMSWPVHIISHSFGGQTVRKLIDIINDGPGAGKTCGVDEPMDSAMCFKVKYSKASAADLIAASTSISTPHNGTTLTNGVDHLTTTALKQNADEIYDDVMWIYNLTNDNFAFVRGLYGLKLDQWNGVPAEVMNETPDMSFYDLSTVGAPVLTQNETEDPNIYYFSWVTARGGSAGCTVGQDVSILGCLSSFGFAAPSKWGIGGTTGWSQPAGWDGNWAQHDAVVNVWSQAGPKIGRAPGITYRNFNNFKQTPAKGQWNCLGFVNEDHLQITGVLNQNWMQDYIRDGYLSTRQEPNTVGANEYATAGEVRIVDWYQNTIDMMRSMP
jgi:triacylglycerol lipase